MNIGIIIHSQTGNTLSVAEKLRAALALKGHNAKIERVAAEGEKPQEKDIKLISIPDCEKYDALIFGAPVWAFSLSPVMREFLKLVPALGDKKVCCFVTQHFGKPWLGGNRSVRQMSKMCSQKGASISGTGVINWSSKEKENQIAQLTARFSEI
ncbi:MAG: flavodoxin [Bacillota bacterium]|nr:flavodoxin [Bacillota bacterium]